MKRILPILVVMLVALTSSNLQAQQLDKTNQTNNEHRHGAWCGSLLSAEQLARHEAFVEEYYHRGGKERYQANGRATKYVPISYHIVSKSNRTGGRSIKDALNDLCVLQQDMLHADIQFYLKPNANKGNVMIQLIPNDGWLNGSVGANTGQFTLMTSLNNDHTAVNLYQVKTIRGTSGLLGIATGAGNSFFNGGAISTATNAIFVKNGEGDKDHTLAHEFGHHFSLPHTFYGWEGDAATTSDYVCGANAPADKSKYDGSNCTTAGDRLCDTDPDYIRQGFQCSGTVTLHTCQQVDANGGTGFAEGANVMSYGFGCVNKSFSTDQINTMDAHLTTHLSSFIANTPSLDVIAGTSALNPADATLYDAVVLDWSAATNATHYGIEVSLVSNFSASAIIETAVVGGTSYTATSLQPNRKYYWRVIPFNETDFCATTSATSDFTTSNNATSTRTITSVNNVSLRPNFTTSGQSVNLIVDAIESFEADINVYNVQGQLVSQAVQTAFQVGNNVHQINTSGFTSGVYFVTMQTETGIINKKLVVTK
ncbi:MAG: T9SS type A sorting domain-containing protein [Saprospiraceae bacterium]